MCGARIEYLGIATILFGSEHLNLNPTHTFGLGSLKFWACCFPNLQVSALMLDPQGQENRQRKIRVLSVRTLMAAHRYPHPGASTPTITSHFHWNSHPPQLNHLQVGKFDFPKCYGAERGRKTEIPLPLWANSGS